MGVDRGASPSRPPPRVAVGRRRSSSDRHPLLTLDTHTHAPAQCPCAQPARQHPAPRLSRPWCRRIPPHLPAAEAAPARPPAGVHQPAAARTAARTPTRPVFGAASCPPHRRGPSSSEAQRWSCGGGAATQLSGGQGSVGLAPVTVGRRNFAWTRVFRARETTWEGGGGKKTLAALVPRRTGAAAPAHRARPLWKAPPWAWDPWTWAYHLASASVSSRHITRASRASNTPSPEARTTRRPHAFTRGGGGRGTGAARSQVRRHVDDSSAS